MLGIYIVRNWKFLFLLIIIIVMGIIIVIIMEIVIIIVMEIMGVIREWIREMIYMEVNK